MTGDEIVAQARTAFGETTALTLTDDQLKAFLNQAVQELYGWLPPTENLPSIAVDEVVIDAAGQGVIPDTWDKVLEVSDSTGPLVRVDQTAVANIDRLGRYIQPDSPVWSYDGENLNVRPTTAGSVEVTHTEPPAPLTTFGSEITSIPRHYHQSLIHLVTSLAYAQEEDAEQAATYRDYAQSALTTRLGATDGDAG